MKRILFLLLLFAGFLPATAWTQGNASAATAKQVQPKIMVIPRVKDGENMKTFFDSSMTMQIAISKINEAFSKRGANIISLGPALKQAQENMSLNREAGNAQDFKATVLQLSSADIYVETKLDVISHPGRNNANSVTVLLEGYQTGTSNLLGTKVGNSRMNLTSDIGLLTMQAMDSIAESFLNLMQLKFDDIVANGQSVYVELSISPDSKYNFDSEIGTQNKLLSETIDEWFQTHALNGVYNNQGIVANKMILSDVRIPLKNPANPKANYTGTNLYNDIIRFLRSIGLQGKSQFVSNNKILLTIQ